MISNTFKVTSVILLVGLALFALSGQNSALAFQAGTSTHTATSVASPVAPAQATATLTPTATTAPSATSTSKPAATATAVPPTATKIVTATAVIPTATKIVTATATVVPPTATKIVTATTAAATSTITPTVAATVTPTVKATATSTPTKAPTATPTKAPARALSPSVGTVSSVSTAFVVQNIDAGTPAGVTAYFYDVSGTLTGTITASVGVNRSAIIDQRLPGGLPGSPSTFQGSVVLSSNTQLAAIVNEYASNAVTLGTGFRSDSYNGVGSSQADTSALLPQVLKNVTDAAQNKTYNSSITIQNTDPSLQAHVIITYTNIFAVNPTPTQQTHSGITIPPGAAVFLDMSNEAPIWTASFGPATITSDQKIAVIVNQNASGSLLIYRGFTPADAGNSILVTQALTSIFDAGQQMNYGSAIEGLTADGSSTTVTVNYTNLLGTNKTCQLPAGTTFRIDLRPGNWPAGCTPPVNGAGQFFGSVRLTASGGTNIVALSNLQSDFSPSKGIRSSTSRAFVTGAAQSSAFAPLLMNGYLDSGTAVTWGTALEGQFLTGGGTVNITYYPIPSGPPLTDSYVAASNGIFRFDQRAANPQTAFTLPVGDYSAVLTAAGGTFVFTVNSQGASSTLGDALTVYMNQ